MTDLFSVEGFVAFLQVVIIDLSLAGDNAIVVGMAAAGLPPEQRRRAITFGMVGAASLLVVFAGMATQLLTQLRRLGIKSE
jgi:predicted tellurium resistance membrane protein TerC